MKYEDVARANGLRVNYEMTREQLSILDIAIEAELRVNKGTVLHLTFSENEKAFEETIKIMRALLFAQLLTIRAHLEALGVITPEPEDARRAA